MTIITLVFWFKFDQHNTAYSDTEVSDPEMNKLEERIMAAIRDRTGTRVTTGLSDNRPANFVPPPRPASPHHDDNSSRDRGLYGFLGGISSIWLGKASGANLSLVERGGETRGDVGGAVGIPLTARPGGGMDV